ncbi:hypothetical protein LPJ66_000263 [Kickxella alabastrina]|uniref:Uncharacterized protein n=1 Tax=Kickxella alabastrina TaxID=61397 RepID=A0ACC1IWK2_9FUNG|nr:hypothetical protein LPJ66_000263 [Kickxella alabastrina]
MGRLKNLTHGLMPPKAYWNGRFSSGPIWNEYLSLLLNYNLENHAVGVSKTTTIHRKLLNIIPLDPPSTQDQIAEFADTVGKNKRIGSADIAVLEIGSNDAAVALVDIDNGKQTVYEFGNSVSDSVIEQLQSLYDLGFSRILVTNLPSLQHTPVMKSKNREKIAEIVVGFYNRILSEKIEKWRKSVNLISLDIIDLGEFLTLAIGPSISSSLGITDTKSICVGGSWLNMFDDQLNLANLLKYLLTSDSDRATCGDPESRFFFDPIHPSEQVHRLFGYYIFRSIATHGAFGLSESNLLLLIEEFRLDQPVLKPVAI